MRSVVPFLAIVTGGAMVAAACNSNVVVDCAPVVNGVGGAGGGNEDAGGGGTGGTTPACAKGPFVAFVTDSVDVFADGDGLGPPFSFGNLEGLEGANAMCKARGADHMCEYSELLAADAAGQFDGIQIARTFWLQRTTPVVDPIEPKTCTKDEDCGSTFCDPATSMCSWKPGKGGNCNDWTFYGGFLADAEWFEFYRPSSIYNSGGVKVGSLSFHFDADPYYDGFGIKHLCKDGTKLGCTGYCAGTRSLACCAAPCVK